MTKNLDKQNGFVNGMGATITDLDVVCQKMIVRTDQGRSFSVYRWTDKNEQKVFLPFRLGYASTLHKVQGATLKHITLWLDVPRMEAAGYVALSRVEYDRNWQFFGAMKPDHFVPAGYWPN